MTKLSESSEREQRIVTHVTAWELTYGTSPTYRDLAHLERCSLDTIHGSVQRLLAAGRLRWDPGHLRLPRNVT